MNEKNVTIILLKKDECANYILYTQLGRDGRNEIESTHTTWGATDLKQSGIDLDLQVIV